MTNQVVDIAFDVADIGSVNYISANTGQLVRIVIQTIDGYGNRCDLDGYGYPILDGYGNPANSYTDGYVAPVVESVLLPDLTWATGYPQAMTRLSLGLYASSLILQNGVSAVGTYIVSVRRLDNEIVVWDTYVINVGRPFGITSVTPV
jgi:hypothetical protein